MGSFLKAPRPPAIPQAKETPPIPNEVDPDVKKARTDQRRRARRFGGRGSTILTSGQGLLSKESNAQSTLLGR